MSQDATELTAAKMFNFSPSYNITFHNAGKKIGVLDFNGPSTSSESS